MASTAQINIRVDSKQADNSVNKLNQELGQTVKQTTSLKAQLRAMQNELNNLDEGSTRFRELSIEAGKLRDQIKDTQDVINSTAGSSVENLGTALNSTASIGIAGFQAITSAQALFGSESEDLQKTLVKLQALAGLSDAIKTLGGLGDTMTQIKASAMAAAQSMGILTVATEAETVATEGATVAQEGLNTTMKANPVALIITGVLALVTALSILNSKTSESTKEEEKRRKAYLATIEAQKQSIKTISDESTKFVSLIYQLKQTNENSKQRKDLIKEINTEYGTTLKNISDEAQFQKILNKEVADYIQYQTVKLRIQKNEEAFNKVLTKKLELETKIQNIQIEAERVSKKLNITVGEYYRNNSELVKSLEEYQAQLSGAEFKLQSYTKRIDVLKTSEDELTNGGKKYVEQSKEIVKANDDLKKSYNELYNEIKTLGEEANTKEIELSKLRNQRTKDAVDDIEYEKEVALDAITLRYTETKKKINEQIKDEKDKASLLKSLEFNYQKYVVAQNNLTQEQLNQLYTQRRKDAQKMYDDLTVAEKVLQNEITFGNNNVTDSLKSLYNRRQRLELDRIETQLQGNDLEFGEFKKLQDKKLALLIGVNDETEKSVADFFINTEKGYRPALKQASVYITSLLKNENEERKRIIKAERDLQIAEIVKSFETQYDLTVKYNEDTKQYEVKTTKEKQDEINKMGAEDIQKRIDLEKKATEVINKQNENLNKEAKVKEAESDEQFRQETEDAEKKTQDAIFQYRVEKVQLFSQLASQLLQGLQNLQQTATDERLKQIDSIYNAEIEANNAALANKKITDEEYNKVLKETENKKAQEEKALKRQSFQSNKRFSIAQATIDGINAVLSTYAGTPGGIVIKTLAATVAGVFAAMQVAAIESTEFYAAKGGIVPQNGRPSSVDSVPSMLAPGETVINSNSSGLFPELLNLVNMAGGGNNLLPQVSLGNTSKPQPVYNDNKQTQTIRAYVVEQDITSSQQRVKRIQNTTTF
jgi:hypothetical protein